MNRAATIALTPLSILYGGAIKAREGFYRSGWFRTRKVDAPVISVGNITTGGTGKTPLVEWIARHLAQQQRRVCILTRGYGRANSHQRVIASNGNEILADANQAGDEALMLAEILKGATAVVCDADRVSAAAWAIENLQSDVFVLDDGFQHRRLARDLNIVTIDATNPWGNGKLLPAGMLREPIKALRRADCILLTRADETTDPGLLKQIHEASDAVVIRSRIRTSQVRDLGSSVAADGTASLKSKPLAAFCGVGNPQAFSAHLHRENFNVVHTLTFRDHHKFTQPDVDQINREAIALGAQALVTTAKDEVKLRSRRFDLPVYVIDIAIDIAEPDKLIALIETAVQSRQST